MKYKDISISYTTKGKGNSIVLLHGYLETNEIWKEFAVELSKNNMVTCIDLLGHGESGSLSNANTMDEMANAVNKVLEHEDISKSLIVGHSMGGYVALSIAKYHKDKVVGICLFHSNYVQDDEQRKQNRLKSIELIQNGKKNLLVSTAIPNTFANYNLQKFDNELNAIINRAQTIAGSSIIATLKGMMNRADHTETLKNIDIPVLSIIGKNDNLMNFEEAFKIQELSKWIRVDVLENSGHQGYIEEKEKSLSIINQFISKIF